MPARAPAPFTFRPLTPGRWADFERLFGPRGACAGCWCTFFKLRRPEWTAGQGEGNRRRQRAWVNAGHVPGLLAYDGEAPVGWVAVEPRERYPLVLASRTTRPADAERARPAWAITCFYVARPARGRGLMRALVDAAVEHARSNGAERVEAYPVDYARRVGATFLYQGVASVFAAAGFEEIARPARTRPIVRKDLSAPRARRAPGRARGRSRPGTRRTPRSAARRGR
jgi:GNAT superfamily N-acetyltransferase